MKILHTSDWHLGRSLYGRSRIDEFSSFLDWLIETINREEIDTLLVCGDIFDTTTPGNRAQQLYYSFLHRAAESCCSHIVIISGNHDSPSFLNAPKEILRYMNIHIIADIEDLEDEVLFLKDKTGEQMGVVCAVPYLRDRDIRVAEAGESSEEKNIKSVNGIKEHYKSVCDRGLELREGKNPLIAMGHLFASGGKTMDGDGVRDLYIGSLAHIGAEIFPSYVDYVALGHLHIPQKIGGEERIRYSGSPIPMGFGEASQNKVVISVDFSRDTPVINSIAVPEFQKLIRVRGDRSHIINKVSELKDSDAWVEIEYIGNDIPGNLQADIEEIIGDSPLEIRVIKNGSVRGRVLSGENEFQDLEELGVEEVFKKCLDFYEIESEESELLMDIYRDVVVSVMEEEGNI